MTTDNPNPLEVWRLAMEAHNTAFHDERDACPFESATKAAAAIIAQHYAPVIAENERLREALKPFADIRTQMPESIKLIQKNVDGMKPITITVTKAQMQTAVATLAKLEKARG